MAAKPQSSLEMAIHLLQDCITCTICKEHYKNPRSLNCLHIFCEKCLIPLECEKKITCPKCRGKTFVPDEVCKLPTAFHINKLLDVENSLKKADWCSHHPEKEVDLYCETCKKLICNVCLVADHHDHQFDLVTNMIQKFEKAVHDLQDPVEETISLLEQAISSVDEQYSRVVEHRRALTEEISTTMDHLHQSLDARNTELVKQAKELTLDRSYLQLGTNKYFNYDEIDWSVKRIRIPIERVSAIRFSHVFLLDLIKCHQMFGKIYWSSLCYSKCQASGRGIRLATKGVLERITMEARDNEGKPHNVALNERLNVTLFSSSSDNSVIGVVNKKDLNCYHITYRPEVTGKHTLNITIDGFPISRGPFIVSVIPDFASQRLLLGDLNGSSCIAITKTEVIVAESNGHCVSVFGYNGERKLVLNTMEQYKINYSYPQGVALNKRGNILVVDEDVYLFSQQSKQSSSSLDFKDPTGICVHPLTQDIYVADTGNHRIQVLHPDLTYSFSFGCEGSKDGELIQPYDIAIDNEGHVYVVDYGNHRIQVYSTDGQYLRQFGGKGNRWGDLYQPASICIYSNCVVYVGELGNNRISIFTINGEFIKSLSFGYPLALATNSNGALFVSDKETIHVYD